MQIYCVSGTVHWPAGNVDWGHIRVILFDQWVGHRLLSEKVTGPHERVHRHLSISSVPVPEGIEIRQGCQFISIRPLGKLLGGIGRFLPCRVGSHMSRLRHLGCSVRMVSLHDLWRVVTINVFRLYV